MRFSCLLLAASLCFTFYGRDAEAKEYYYNPFLEEFDSSWKVQHDPFVLHAIPKCGIHFIQRILQLMLPKHIYTSGTCVSSSKLESLDMEQMILRLYSPYNPECMKRMLQTGHKIISMVRDPRDALVSHLFYMRSFPSQEKQRDFFFVSTEFNNLPIDEQIHALIKGNIHSQSYMKYYKERLGWALSGNCMIVKYEDFVGDVGGGSDARRSMVLKQLADFLNMHISLDHFAFIQKNMYAVIQYNTKGGQDLGPERNDYHSASIGNWKTFLKEEHKVLLKERIGQALIDLGYEDSMEW